jgi:hypothetical protein
VAQGDLAALKEALRRLEVPEDQLPALEHALHEDAKSGEKGIGKKTSAWLAAAGAKVGKAGLAIGQEVVKEWPMQYLGLK